MLLDVPGFLTVTYAVGVYASRKTATVSLVSSHTTNVGTTVSLHRSGHSSKETDRVNSLVHKTALESMAVLCCVVTIWSQEEYVSCGTLNH